VTPIHRHTHKVEGDIAVESGREEVSERRVKKEITRKSRGGHLPTRNCSVVQIRWKE